MITGDHPLTAKNIAQEVGMEVGTVVTGQEIEKMDRHQLEEVVMTTNVFARVSPIHKLLILRALQNHDYFVAMTGDGVNDAAALKEAHIGIAVGSGTDITKEVSDMILMDDNFATITVAIMEGRGIFSNIKKFVKFLLAANFDEILVILGSIVLGTPLPMLPIHLLWLNVVTDSAPAMALSVDQYEPDLMDQPPVKPEREILHGLAQFSLVAGVLAFVASFAVFLHYYYGMGSSLVTAQTITFTVTVFFELFLVFAVRSKISAFKAGIFTNKWLLAAVALATSLQLAAIYLPFAQELLKTTSIALAEWPKILAFAASGFIIIEIIRAIKYQHLPLLIQDKLKRLKTA
jgi:Ca2+-transporting ATPase